MQAATPLIGSLMALALLAACGQGHAPSAARGGGPSSSELSYHAPPELVSAGPAPDGRLQLAGTASPGVAVRLASPEAPPLYSTADGRGFWRLAIGPSPAPRLLSLSMSDKGRTIWAMGYLFLAPDGAAVRLRSGGGSEALAPGGVGLTPLTLDYDSRGAVTLSGRAAPGETVGLRVDRVERGQARADAGGRFMLSLNEPLKPGPHDFELVGGASEVRFAEPVGAPARLAGTPFAAARFGGGWRVDWITPGGGEQTTLVLEGRAT